LLTIRRLTAELLGTFLLTLSAAAPHVLHASIGVDYSTPIQVLLPALVVAVWIYALGDVSGAHLNPAVTIAFWLRQVFPLARVPGYIAAQVAGGILAAVLLRARFGPVSDPGANVPHVDVATAFWCEVLLTAILVVVILNVATKESLVGPQAAIPVAFAIALDGFLGSGLSGASMNPARSLGPALVAHHLADQWIYVLGPCVGAVIAWATTWLLHGADTEDEQRAAQGDGAVREPKQSENARGR
jgi:aquaporin Z